MRLNWYGIWISRAKWHSIETQEEANTEKENDTFSLLGCLENVAGQCLLSISKCLDKITLKASTFLVVLIYSAIALNEVGKGTGNVWR